MKARCLLFLLLVVQLHSSCKKEKTQQEAKPHDIQLNKVIFTDPAKVKLRQENSTEIFDQLIKYFDAASVGSVVYVNIYLVDYIPIINAVIKAHEKGVKVHMLVDRSRAESIETNVSAIQKLQGKLTGQSSFTIVNNDISSGTSGSINHLKYVLFADLQTDEGNVKNVVFSTSSNFTAADMKKIQDAVVISDESLYSAFKVNWAHVQSFASGGMSAYNYQTYGSSNGDINAYFFPRRLNGAYEGNDTIIEILDKISDYGNTTVQVGMSDWSDTRVNVVQKLIALQEKGVRIEVIAKSSSGALIHTELQKLKAKGAYVNILVLPVNIHAKFMLIKGMWDGKPNSEVIVTGTHNFTSNALKVNNEVILLLRNNLLFSEYQNYYNKLKNTFK